MEFIKKTPPPPVNLGEDVVVVPDKLIKPLLKEISYLIKEREEKLELCPGFWIEYTYMWEEDDYMSIGTHELKASSKIMKSFIDCIDNDEIDDFLLDEVDFSQLNKRIRKVIGDCNETARKHGIDEDVFFDRLLDKAGDLNEK